MPQGVCTVPDVIIVAITVGNNIPVRCNRGIDGGDYGFAVIE